MTRKPRNYVPHLTAEYARRHPDRPQKTDFSDEVLCAVAFVMRQIDPEGKKPIIEPAMPAYEGYDPQPSAQASARRERSE